MMPRNPLLTALLVAAALVLPPAAQAQMAVIDVASLTQLLQQIQTMERMLDNARSQLAQAQQAYQIMTGTRGMQQLVSGVVRNYLPGDWQQLSGALQSLGGAYPALAASITTLQKSNAVLSQAQISALSPQGQQQIQGARTLAAASQAMSRDAFANGSSRFADLQGLIAAIGAATDQKSILDLTARIAAEQGMLQNEQNKLQSLFQSLQAQDTVLRLQERENIVAGHGSFAGRFQPSP